jgi:hypothetical protein
MLKTKQRAFKKSRILFTTKILKASFSGAMLELGG